MSCPQIATYTMGTTLLCKSQFKGRIGFTARMPSLDVSLYINATQELDSGHYRCQVIIPKSPVFTAQLSLAVKGERQMFFTLKITFLRDVQHDVKWNQPSSSQFPRLSPTVLCLAVTLMSGGLSVRLWAQ